MYSTARITSLLPSVKRRSYTLLLIVVIAPVAFGQSPAKKSVTEDTMPSVKVNIAEQLNIFSDTNRHALYRISLCADVPYNKNPSKVAHKQETGHVFLILQKINGRDTISNVFGFYPKAGFQAVFFKNVKSSVRDNSGRRYDAGVTKELTAAEFDTVIAKAVVLSEKRYHMNRYNCYDYAMLIFNAVAGDSPLPFNHIRFPFLFGRGGSPCGLYRDLKLLQENGSLWAGRIVFGDLVAPVSYHRRQRTGADGVGNQ